MVQGTASLLRELFVTRDDAYAEQWVNQGSGESGYIKAVEANCPNDPPCTNFRCEHRQPRKLVDSIIGAHLAGRVTIGIYQLSTTDTVKWICLDIDKDKNALETHSAEELHKNAQEQVRRIVSSALLSGVKPVVEDSGNRGYHVWVFFDKEISAAKAQAVGHHVINGVEMMAGMNIEVFPKQISTKSLGNLVKLPLGVHLKSKRRSAFVNREFEPFKDQLKFLEKIPRHNEEFVDAVINWYGLKIADIRRNSDDLLTSVGKRVPLCLSKLLVTGVGDGMRDIATFKIACYLRDRGLPEDITQASLSVWNERNKPALSAAVLSKKVESAYRDTYGFLPCFEAAFDPYCSSSCDFYDFKKQRRS